MQDDAALRRRRRRGRRLPRRARRRRPRRRHRRRARCASTPASASARPPRTTSSCSARLDELVARVDVPVARRHVAQDVPRTPSLARRRASARRATTPPSPPSCGRSTTARGRAGARRRARPRDAVALLERDGRDSMREGGRVKGRWAQGLEPRAFCWIIKDRLAASERPGGFARNHRKVRRQEELIWLIGHGFTHVLSCSTRRTTCTRTRKRASRTRTCPLGRHDEWADAPAACSTPRSRAGWTTPRSGCSSTTRSSATACSACSPATSSTPASSPRARTRSSSIEKITGRQLGVGGARDRRGHGRREDRRPVRPRRRARS